MGEFRAGAAYNASDGSMHFQRTSRPVQSSPVHSSPVQSSFSVVLSFCAPNSVLSLSSLTKTLTRISGASHTGTTPPGIPRRIFGIIATLGIIGIIGSIGSIATFGSIGSIGIPRITCPKHRLRFVLLEATLPYHFVHLYFLLPSAPTSTGQRGRGGGDGQRQQRSSRDGLRPRRARAGRRRHLDRLHDRVSARLQQQSRREQAPVYPILGAVQPLNCLLKGVAVGHASSERRPQRGLSATPSTQIKHRRHALGQKAFWEQRLKLRGKQRLEAPLASLLVERHFRGGQEGQAYVDVTLCVSRERIGGVGAAGIEAGRVGRVRAFTLSHVACCKLAVAPLVSLLAVALSLSPFPSRSSPSRPAVPVVAAVGEVVIPLFARTMVPGENVGTSRNRWLGGVRCLAQESVGDGMNNEAIGNAQLEPHGLRHPGGRRIDHHLNALRNGHHSVAVGVRHGGKVDPNRATKRPHRPSRDLWSRWQGLVLLKIALVSGHGNEGILGPVLEAGPVEDPREKVQRRLRVVHGHHVTRPAHDHKV
eukprot:scaffold73_cov252-Pinguiococcus_pyrenoidosus.AAC.22